MISDMIAVESQLKENYKKKISMMKTFLEAARKIEACIVSDDTQTLTRHLNERDRMIKEIDTLEDERQQLMKLLGVKAGTGIDKAALAGIKELQDELNGLISDIASLDKENISAAKMKMDEYKNQVVTSRQMKKGIRTYLSPYTLKDGIYIDAKK
jgi:hypothetical protein